MNVALLGNGHVATALIKIIDKDKNSLYSYNRSSSNIGNEAFVETSSNFNEIGNSNIDIVIDMLSHNDEALEISREVIKSSLLNNKAVITCNKRLMSVYGIELCNYAKDTNGKLYINSLVASSSAFSKYPEYLSIDNFLKTNNKEIIFRYRGAGPDETAEYINNDLVRIQEKQKWKIKH